MNFGGTTVEKTLKWSLENHQPIEVIYMDNKGQITQRIIKVLAINSSSARVYCYYRKQQRLFHLDKILSACFLRKRKGA